MWSFEIGFPPSCMHGHFCSKYNQWLRQILITLITGIIEYFAFVGHYIWFWRQSFGRSNAGGSLRLVNFQCAKTRSSLPRFILYCWYLTWSRFYHYRVIWIFSNFDFWISIVEFCSYTLSVGGAGTDRIYAISRLDCKILRHNEFTTVPWIYSPI